MSTTSEIITSFEQYVDDTTELSSAQELVLADKIYRKICNFRPWEFLKKEFIGAITGLTVTLPDDFAYMTENTGHTGLEYEQGTKVVFVGTGSSALPIKLINWSDRKQYIDDDVCYLDVLNNNLVFTRQQTVGATVSFDYIHNPVALTLGTSPIFPSRFHDIIYHGMAIDDYIIQQFPKANSYAAENAAMYKSWLDDMSYWNSNLINIS